LSSLELSDALSFLSSFLRNIFTPKLDQLGLLIASAVDETSKFPVVLRSEELSDAVDMLRNGF
jgi:hypothetical protein